MLNYQENWIEGIKRGASPLFLTFTASYELVGMFMEKAASASAAGEALSFKIDAYW
ncbi:MAG: hypothetical protein HZA77_13155 [Candidatus Schekmanbacteria bacterium]|nr:hypothetical protein [Candidatus Schekmanbacteria bacterium]